MTLPQQKPITLLYIPGLSMLMTYPVFHHTRIYTLNGSTPAHKTVSFCIEDWQLSSSNQSNYDPSTRLPYSIFSMVFQFGIPFVFISAIYISIYRYLKKHRSVKQWKPITYMQQKPVRVNQRHDKIQSIKCKSTNLFGSISFNANQTQIRKKLWRPRYAKS